MCGIVGYTGVRPAVGILLEGLKRLEYRGYDSSGVAFFRKGLIEVRKSEGKLENVARDLQVEAGTDATVTCGIGHTRWATHGKPTTQNAHPHQVGEVVLVHNGIIENYQEIRSELAARGRSPRSETDSELFGFLVQDELDAGQGFVEAVRLSMKKIRGQASIVALCSRNPGVVVGARQGSPLVVARDPSGGVLFASDAQPLLPINRSVIFLENGDLAVGDSSGLKILDLASGKTVERPETRLDWSPEKVDKGGYEHFMLKEIHEQPVTLIDTLNSLLDRSGPAPFTLAAQPGVDLLRQARELVIVACGTSFHAALLGKYWIESLAQIPVQVELASEFRYRRPVLRPGVVVLGISQSGETADTLAVLREVRSRGLPTVGITNVRGSTLSREAQACFHTAAGPEIGVAATKTFLAQCLTQLLFAGALSSTPQREVFDQLLRLPHLLEESLRADSPMISAVREAARALQDSRGFFFMGRGTSYPIALEGALKLKEIAYVHAEGYAAGELKHGPIAMIDREMTVVVLAPRDTWRDKTVSNLEEVKSRGARILGVGASSDQALRSLCDYWIPVPDGVEEALLPFVVTPAVQLLSYELACLKGTDVDKPRNLAKSVTVE